MIMHIRRILPLKLSFLRIRKAFYLFLFLITFVPFIHMLHQSLPQTDAGSIWNEFTSRTSLLPHGVSTGNAHLDGKKSKGWWVGHFANKSPLHHSESVETKWAVHHKDATNGAFVVNKHATSMALLISGRHRIEFGRTSVVLETPGDYVIWGPGVPHSWTALTSTTILSVRWPSLADDQLVHNSSYTNRIKARQLLTSKKEMQNLKRSNG